MEISTSSATIVSSPSYLPIFFPKSKDPYSISRRILRFSISPKNNGNESELRSDSNDSSLVPILINRTLSKDAAMGLVLSATNVRGWSTSSAMEGPPVPAVSESESSTEKFSTFPWNNSLILDNSLIGLALIDALTGQVVSSGPISAAKAEIVVLEGDFDGNEVNNWTHEEFKSNLVREREGKKTLLTGDAFLNLKEGVGLLGEISFTDNSSWTRSRKFRLGARVMDNWDGIRVREAKTESFIVRDHRGELYKKHYPSSLYDEVWRLEKIVKEGAFHKHLSREKVNKGIEMYGLGNWNEVTEHVRTKSRSLCVDNYNTIYMNSLCFLFSDMSHIMGKNREELLAMARGLGEVKKGRLLLRLALQYWVSNFRATFTEDKGRNYEVYSLYICRYIL